MKKKIDKKAFTLIEVIVYVAIIGLLVVSFISFALAVSSLRSKNYVASEVNANLRVASEIIGKKIRGAQEVLAPAIGATSSQIFLDMPGSDPDIKILQDQGRIYLVEVGIATSTLTSSSVNIKNLEFAHYSSGNNKSSINFTINAEYGVSNSLDYNYENSLQTSVNIKN